MTCTLLIMRHGTIKANLQKCWHGSTDSPLLWRGRRQAKRLGRFASKQYPRLSAIYASPLQRCQDTAAPLAKELGLDIRTDMDLREWSIGDWETISFRQLADDHDFFNRTIRDVNWAAPNGESIQHVADRCVASLKAIVSRHTNDIADTQVGVVSHGAAMQVALAALIDANPKRWQSYTIGNASITELVLEPDAYIENYNLMHYL